MSAPAWANPAWLGLECPACGAEVAPAAMTPVCGTCGGPWLARYDLDAVARGLDRPDPAAVGLARLAAALPFSAAAPGVTLGEGGTPLLESPALARAEGVATLWIKEEAGNPTGSFKARGLAMAVTGARATGRDAIALPSAGNAGSAAAAYAAAAGMRCRITVPEDTPEPFIVEQRGLGAEVKLVRGTISDAGKALAAWAPPDAWWNVATFKEPFRAEGKKTLGYEIAAQTGWRPPDAILYPTGGGTGLVGMWRAFLELEAMGRLRGPLPRLVAVQVAGCAPIVRAYDAGASRAAPWEDAHTLASGLRVPAPFADALILRAVRETGGTAVAVEEGEWLHAMRTFADHSGVLACPEGAATLAALRRLRAAGDLDADSRVAIFNTGSGLKYLEAWRAALAPGGAS